MNVFTQEQRDQIVSYLNTTSQGLSAMALLAIVKWQVGDANGEKVVDAGAAAVQAVNEFRTLMTKMIDEDLAQGKGKPSEEEQSLEQLRALFLGGFDK